MYILSSAIVLEKNPETNHVLPRLLLLYDEQSCTYYFPKCYVDSHAGMQEGLVAAVADDTGASILVRDYLSFVTSVVEHENRKIRKKTHYFIAEYVGGDLCTKEGFSGRVCFYTIEEALALLQFQGVHTLGYEDEYDLLKQYTQIIY